MNCFAPWTGWTLCAALVVRSDRSPYKHTVALSSLQGGEKCFTGVVVAALWLHDNIRLCCVGLMGARERAHRDGVGFYTRLKQSRVLMAGLGSLGLLRLGLLFRLARSTCLRQSGVAACGACLQRRLLHGLPDAVPAWSALQGRHACFWGARRGMTANKAPPTSTVGSTTTLGILASCAIACFSDSSASAISVSVGGLLVPGAPALVASPTASAFCPAHTQAQHAWR